MFVWAPIPEPYAEMDSVEFCSMHRARRATSRCRPGVGFGPGGEGFVRFALIENEKRIAQGIRNLEARPAEAAELGPVTRCHRPVHARIRPCRYVGHAPLRAARLAARPPGALGQVASRIGAVRGDVVGIEILERGGGRAIDELVVALPDAGLVDLLVTEIAQVDGVDVEDVRLDQPIRRATRRLDALETATRLVGGARRRDASSLCSARTRSRTSMRIGARSCTTPTMSLSHAVGAPPEAAWLVAFLEGSKVSQAIAAGASGPTTWRGRRCRPRVTSSCWAAGASASGAGASRSSRRSPASPTPAGTPSTESNPPSLSRASNAATGGRLPKQEAGRTSKEGGQVAQLRERSTARSHPS